MGLDIVYFIAELENYFGIGFSNSEAEKISTVNDCVESISRLLNVSDYKKILKNKVFNQIQNAILKSGYIRNPVNYTDLVSAAIPDNNQKTWELLSKEMGLKIPVPPLKKENIFSKLFNPNPVFNYSELTFDQFTDVICGENYKELINPEKISCKHEIYVAIMGISVETTGINIYDFGLTKSFTTDFGMD